ncbi:Discoidin domain protein [Chitinispirillum alkaliphilum]|nr:Discoidin domain protein [Chitinispirillum alkaliphilum]
MWIKWFPWKFVLKRVARAQGFIDPVMLMSRFSQFAQPAEVLAPVELLRAGAVLHARGLINSQVIQHNLDWVWPYWAERQFEPTDPSFVPRAFSISQINLTHRNWTAVGVPGVSETPVVDPRGLVMPFYDSWSIDVWIIAKDGRRLIPSRSAEAKQEVRYENGYRVVTLFDQDGMKLRTSVEVDLRNGLPVCRVESEGKCRGGGYLVVSLRPYNPEGISFIHKIKLMPSAKGWQIDRNQQVWFDQKPSFYRFSNYQRGDVYHWVDSKTEESKKMVSCDVGMATALAAYSIDSRGGSVAVDIPLFSGKTGERKLPVNQGSTELWEKGVKQASKVQFDVNGYGRLYELALRTLILHTSGECYAGPYTYKRFWFRDSAFIVNALVCAGLNERARKVIESYFSRQTSSGYFLSQDGEWDSNGQALWAIMRYCMLGREKPAQNWREPIIKACSWIAEKRRETHILSPFAGLMPSGFSAEHLGLNDHYYWDNFWSVAGLGAGAYLLRELGDEKMADKFMEERKEYMIAIESSLEKVNGTGRGPAMPASPNRRLDSGSVGSLAAGYPLELWEEKDKRVTETADYLYQHCLIDDAFYHDISHSGINPYLSLHIAQVMLRASNPAFSTIMHAISDLASPTGQWPEAIHPQLKTGCMGDGQHTWAAAEWIVMVRNCFIREEKNSLILCQGIFPSYLNQGKTLFFGPAPTKFGPCRVQVSKEEGNGIVVKWSGDWRGEEPDIVVALAGTEGHKVQRGAGFLQLES